MSSQPIADMTMDELEQRIEEMIDRRLQAMLKPQTNQSTDELLDYIDQHRIKLPKGAKSSLQMLREDRDA